MGQVLTAELGWRPLQALLSSLAIHRQLPAAKLDKLKAILASTDAAEQNRNTLLHSTWLAGAPSDPAIRFKITAKRNSGLAVQNEVVLPGQIRQVADELAKAAFEIMTFTQALRS